MATPRSEAPPGAELPATIGEAFLAAATEHGDRPAILTADGALTYDDLAGLALHGAARFAAGGPSGRPVAIAMPRGKSMVAAMLGAAIAQRPWSVLSNLGSTVLLRRQLEAIGACDLACLDGPGAFGDAIAGLDVRVERFGAAGSGPDPGGWTHRPSALAAICFTSGSTGAPKGVALRHDSSVHNAARSNRSLRMTADDRYLWLASPASAASSSSLFATLLHGACLLPFDIGTQGFSALGDWIVESRATVFHSIPGVFRRFVRSVGQRSTLASLRVVKLGGEAVFASDVSLFAEKMPRGAMLVNGLGLSEANGNVSHEVVARDETFDEQVPIGHPLPGVTLTILDDDGAPVAAGEPGRLSIEGAFLAQGYWDAASSRAVPFAPAPSGGDRRVFRSEDRCVRLADGRLVHLGRADGIVKVRGVRVSLAAVEARLRDCPLVADVVVAAGGEETNLSAWVEPLAGGALTSRAVRAHLARHLPPEAIPRRIAVGALPLLANGKVDRRSLIAATAAETASPQERHEQGAEGVARLFADALGRASFGVDENFFEAGGDSLAAATLAAALEEKLARILEPAELAIHPTPREIHDGAGGEDIRPAVRLSTGDGNIPLWLIGGAGVPVFHLLPLAQALTGHAPIYGFGSGLDRAGRLTTRVEAMTAPMLRSLREVQPDGPYLLAGNSFGGWLALDLANRLSAQGARVAFLGMLDAGGPGYPALLPTADRRARRRHWDRVIFRNYRAGLAPGRWRLTALRRRGATLARALRGSALEPLELRLKLRAQEEACLIARFRHSPRRFDGGITTFHAAHRWPDTYRTDPTLGWERYSARPIRSVAIPGTHGTFMYEPQVSVLAAAMIEEINRILPW